MDQFQLLIGFFFNRIISERLPPGSSLVVSSQSSSIRSRSRSRPSLAESSSRATPQLAIRSLCDRVAKTDDSIVILKETLAWKSMSDEFLSQEVDIIFGFN